MKQREDGRFEPVTGHYDSAISFRELHQPSFYVKFQISFPGLGFHPASDRVIVDLGPDKAWIIPQNGSTYFLSGTLSVEREKADHSRKDWSGTLELPNVEIPKGR